MEVFVIHAEKLKERGHHIDSMLRSIGMDYCFINEGKNEELIQTYLNSWMKNGLENMCERTSSRVLCTLSHFLAYKRIIDDGIEGALILEDDIVLHKGFLPQFEQSIKEYEKYYSTRKIIISYEDSTLQLIPRSQREKGKMLYLKKDCRLAGAYYINRNACISILEHLETQHCDRAIDWYNAKLIKEGYIECLWCHPALATQGSFTGLFKSSMSKKKDHIETVRWWLKKRYKQLLYWFR